jgi:poly(A) polymerase
MTTARLLDHAPWLTAGPAARALQLLNADGEEARVVGGSVRNALLNMPIGDIDIATTALPEEVARRAKAAGIKCVPTGIEHGTVTLVIDAHPFEVTTLREDTETFGRKAKVSFGRDWVGDAKRRDFTINGLSVDAVGRVHDYVGGLDDIAARRVRFIGDANMRIAEDYLRILRFFRIHAAYGAGEVDRAGYLACINGRAGLAALSAERIRLEVLKLMVANGVEGAVTAMIEGGLLLPIFGGVAYAGPFAAIISAERALGLEPDPIRRLGALAVAVTEDARRLAMRMRLTNAETKALDSMGHRWWRLAGMDEATARRRLYRLGEDRYRDRLMLAWARSGEGSEAASWRELATLPSRWTAPKFPLKATDFIARGIVRGPELGQVLALAEDGWLAADFPLDAPSLHTIADQAVARLNREARP